jgi:hypothetical protein
MQGFNPFDPQRLAAAVAQEGNQLQAQTQQQGNLLDRLSAYERNFVDHDLGLKGNDTNRYGIDTGRQNVMSQLASQDKNYAMGDATNRFGIQAGYDSNLFSSLSNLAGNRYGADRSAQAALGSAALGAQSSMLGPMLQQQRFNTMAPYVTSALGSLNKGMGSNLSNAMTGGK